MLCLQFTQPLSWRSLNPVHFSRLYFIYQLAFDLAIYSKAYHCSIVISVLTYKKVARWIRMRHLILDVVYHAVFPMAPIIMLEIEYYLTALFGSTFAVSLWARHFEKPHFEVLTWPHESRWPTLTYFKPLSGELHSASRLCLGPSMFLPSRG